MQDRLLGVARDLEAAIVTPEMAISADLIADGVPVGSDASEDGPAADAGNVVEVGEDVDASSQRSEPVVLSGLDDPAYEDLWDGTETIGLEVPDIPPLDLSWGDEDDQAEPGD
jgi:hypothetical protein